MASNHSVPTKVIDKDVGPIGYGLMSLTLPAPWGPVEPKEAIKNMKTALESGANLWNGGTFYGTPMHNSLHILRDYFKAYPEDAEKVVLCIKGAFSHKDGPAGSAEAITASVDDALQVLAGSKKIDIFEMARVDPNTPIETSVHALASLVKEGKIGGIGLSEVSASTIRKAHALHPISAVEIELSLFTTDPLHNGIMATCHELSIPVAAYSPVGRGWLTGKFRTHDEIPANSFHHMFSRFKPEVFEQNAKLASAIEEFAKRKNMKTSQVAIAWVIRQGAIPIPGSSNAERIALNSRNVSLTDNDVLELQKIIETFPVAGERYGGTHEKYLNA